MPQVEFGPYMPDLPTYQHPGVLMAKNLVPRARGFGAMPSLQPVGTEPLDARVRGAVTGRDKLGQTFVIAGTETKLWYTTTGAPVDVSEVSNGYSTAAAGAWEIIQYGQEIFATNLIDEVQHASLSTLSGVAPFLRVNTDNTWNMPQAKHIGVIRDFVMLGNVNDIVNTGDGEVPERVAWLPIANPAQALPDYGTSAAKALQADYQDIRGRAGAVQRIIGASEIGLIFMEKQLWRADYVGGQEIFSFWPIDEERGLLVPASAAAAGRWTFFLTEHGFYKTDGQQTLPIGKERVDRTFFADVDLDHAHRITAAVDPEQTIYVMAYPGAGHSGGTPNKFQVYDYVLDKWSHGEEALEILVQVLPASANLDDTSQFTTDATWDGGDEVTGKLFYNGVEVSNMDAATFLGDLWSLGAYDTAHAQARFSGDPKEILIETGDFEITPGRESHLSGVRAVSNCSATQVAVAARGAPNDAVVYGAFISPTPDTGLHDFRIDGRYHRAQIRVQTPRLADAWQGLDLEAVASGNR